MIAQLSLASPIKHISASYGADLFCNAVVAHPTLCHTSAFLAGIGVEVGQPSKLHTNDSRWDVTFDVVGVFMGIQAQHRREKDQRWKDAVGAAIKKTCADSTLDRTTLELMGCS